MDNQTVEEKPCRKCGELKILDDFHKHKKMTDGHLHTCKVCHNAYTRARSKVMFSERRATADNWISNNKEKVAAYKKAYKERDRKRHLKQKSEYAKRNREKYNADTAYYRAMKKCATRKYDEFERLVIREIYDLAKLRTKALGKVFHVDHIVPLVSNFVCGLHTMANLQLLEGRANISKSNRFWPDMPEAESI